MRLNHLHLPVADLDRAQAFWCERLGFRPGRRHRDVRFVHDPAGFDLALARHPELLTAASASRTAFHLGFRLDSVQAVEQCHDRLLRAEVTLTEPLTEEADHVWFRVEDPDGHTIEIYWEREAAAESR